MSFEFSEWTVQLASSYDLRLVVVYRPQSDSDNHRIPMTTCFNDFSDHLETIILCKEPLVIVGDFNIHVDVLSNSDSTKFRDLLESFCLQQHVVGPTHIHGHTLDLIITHESDQIVRSTPRVDCFFSDPAPSFSTRTLSYRKIRLVNVDSLNDDLANSELCKNSPDDLEEFLLSHNKTLIAVLDKHAPVKTRTIVMRPQVP